MERLTQDPAGSMTFVSIDSGAIKEKELNMANYPETADAGEQQLRSAWRPIALAIIGASVLITTGVGVFATLSASVNNVTPQDVDSGTLELSLSGNGDGFSQAISNVAPGDVVNRFVTLTNSGSLEGKDLTFQVTSVGTSTLITDGTLPATTKALKVSVTECSVAWTPGTGVCGGTSTTLLSSISLAAAATVQTLISGSIAIDEDRFLRIAIELPDQTEETINGVPPALTIQGGSVEVTYTFVESQRDSETTNS